MYRTAASSEIGKYIGDLIAGKYGVDRQFAIKFIQRRDGTEEEPAPDEIGRMANRICQMKKKGKGIQIEDLPLLAELLEVSVDSILSAGKVSTPSPDRMTNYSVAHSKSKKYWQEYIDKADKPILNEDEYGKTLIDYAICFRNYKLLKYLIDHKYIYLVDPDPANYCIAFGAGTTIKRRDPGSYDLLDYRMKESDRLRTSVIALALENHDYEVLDRFKAREIPPLYDLNYYITGRSELLEQHYDEKMMKEIAASQEDEVLNYFSEEFEIETKTNTNAECRVTFPYLGKLIDMVAKKDRRSAEILLKNALKHDQWVLETVRAIGEIANDSYDDTRQFAREDAVLKCNINLLQSTEKQIADSIMTDFFFREENDTLRFASGPHSAENFRCVFSNVIRVNASSRDERINSLIEEVNAAYDRIKNYRPEMKA